MCRTVSCTSPRTARRRPLSRPIVNGLRMHPRRLDYARTKTRAGVFCRMCVHLLLSIYTLCSVNHFRGTVLGARTCGPICPQYLSDLVGLKMYLRQPRDSVRTFLNKNRVCRMFQIRHQGIGHSRYSGRPQLGHQRAAGQVLVGQRVRRTDRVAKRVASVLVSGKFRATADFAVSRAKLPASRLDSKLTDFRPAVLFLTFQAALSSTQFPYTAAAYGQQLGYWYPQSYPATQLQGQFLQGVQGYTYGQFGYQQGYLG